MSNNAVAVYWSDDIRAERKCAEISGKTGARVVALDPLVPYNLGRRINQSRLNFEVTSGAHPELSRRSRFEASFLLGDCDEVYAVSSDHAGFVAPVVSSALELPEVADKKVLVVFA